MFRATVLLLLATVTVAEAQTQFRIGLRRTYGFGTTPSSCAVADFDRDGNLDLAVASRDVDSVTVRLGDGRGNFGTATRYLTGNGPSHVAAGDLDGDGILDLVISNATVGTVSVLAGRVLGSFAPKIDYPVGSNPQWVAIGDANSDTHPDVVTANISSNNVTVLLGGSPGGLTGASFNLATGAGPSSVQIADINTDGLPDLVTGNQNATAFSVLEGTNTGGFLPKVDTQVGTGAGVAVVGDWNGDGNLDVATANQTSSDVSVCYGDGAGNFTVHEDFPSVLHPTMLVAADVNGDGLVDLVAANRETTQFQLLLRNNGTFSNQTVTVGPGFGGKIAVADVDADGARDVITLYPSTVEIEYNGLAPIGESTPYPTAAQPTFVAAGDLDGDGDHDLAVACQVGNSITKLIGTDEATFPTRTDLPLPFAYSVAMGDLGSDGFPEIVGSTYKVTGVSDSNRVAIYPNLGAGAIGNRIDLDIGSDPHMTVAVGNLNGDANRDIVVGHYESGIVQVYLGNGSNGFTAGPALSAPFPTSVSVLDLNGNGAMDLLVVRADTKASVFLGDGSGGFAPKVDYTIPNFASAPAIGDLDLDGRLDLVVTWASTNLAVLYGGSNGTFTPKVDVPAGPLGQARGVCMADLNGDGFLDLLYGHGVDTIGLRLGLGNRTFGPIIDLPGALEPNSVLADDLDRNGTPDVVFTNATTDLITVLLGLKRTRTTLTVNPSPVAANAPMTLKATVTAVTPDSADATGLVRFFDGFTQLAAAPLSGGVAQITIPAALLWERSLRAEYVGDKHFHASFSKPVSHMTYVPTTGVAPSPSALLALAPLGNPIRPGEALRVRVSLAGDTRGRLTLHDVRGRVLASREVLAGGIVELAPFSRLSPGVYLVTLEQGGRLSTARAVVL